MSADRDFVQYVQVTGPLTSSAPLETTTGWQRQQPGSHDSRRRRGILTALTVMACVLPATFAQGAINPPTGWRPAYPDRVARKVVHAAHQPSFTTRTFVPPDVVVTGGSSIPTGSMRFVQYQGYAGAFLDPPTVVPSDRQVDPVFPDTIARRTSHASRIPSFVVDRFDPPSAASVTALSWAPEYPDAIARTRVHASQQRAIVADTETTTGVAASRNIAWLQRGPDRIQRSYSLATYVWGQQHFGVEIDVPVLSWTGVYLDPPIRRKARVLGSTTQPVDITAQPPAPDLSWKPTYADRVPPARRNPSALTTSQHGLPFVPDVTNPVTVLSWKGVYADRVPGKKRAADYPAYFMDKITAPGVVIAPDLATPVYPFKVYAKPRTPQYPDLQAVIGRQDPPPIVPDGSWIPKFPDRIPPPKGLAAARQLAFTFWPEPIPTPDVQPVTGTHQFIVPMRQRVFIAVGRRRGFIVPPRKRGLP